MEFGIKQYNIQKVKKVIYFNFYIVVNLGSSSGLTGNLSLINRGKLKPMSESDI